MDRREYTDRVLACLRRLTPKERAAVRAEIDAHLEDHICALLDLGYDPELAEQRTMAAMGDPEEVGRKLEKQYPIFWLILGRAAALLLALCCLFFVQNLSGWHVFENLHNRMSIQHQYLLEKYDVEPELRIQAGSDIVYVYGIDLQEDQAIIHWKQYDESPWGYLSEMEVSFADCRGREEIRQRADYSSSAVKKERWGITVASGDPYILLRIDRYGERQETRIPLEWKEQP